MEARLGLPIGGMNKRPEEEAEEGAVAGTQIGFGQFVVGPMFETLGPSSTDPPRSRTPAASENRHTASPAAASTTLRQRLVLTCRAPL